MSDLPDHGDDSRFDFACPTCKVGTLDTAHGYAVHTNTHLKWVDIPCSNCQRKFNFGAGRSVPGPIVGKHYDALMVDDPAKVEEP